MPFSIGGIITFFLGVFIGYFLGRYKKELSPLGKQLKKDLGKIPALRK